MFTLILIDDHSRYVVGHGVDEGAERADMVIKTFEEAVARHGRPERVMDDKGSRRRLVRLRVPRPGRHRYGESAGDAQSCEDVGP